MDRWQVLAGGFGLGPLMQAHADHWLGLRAGPLEGKDCLLPR